MLSKDRKVKVIESKSFNGIDFVEVAADQTHLGIHFLNNVPIKGSPSVTITGGESIPQVSVNDDFVWSHDSGHLVLSFSVVTPGDFSNYTLAISSTRQDSGIDPYFATAVFSFKVGCPSDLDCQAAQAACPTPESDAPPIDYLAKDFLSFRQALLDFSVTRYPDWQERSEADFGVMFMEALCSLADDLSYTQDRIAAEAAWQTATQRGSVVRQAHLVDYWPQPIGSARVVLQFDVEDSTNEIPIGTVVTARGPDGATIPFETGPGLALRSQAAPPIVSSAWNSRIKPYWFDDSQRCLAVGATQMYILGSGYGFQPGQMILIDTIPPNSADPPIRQIVKLLEANELCDPLYDTHEHSQRLNVEYCCATSPVSGTAVTLLIWGAADALTVERDLTGTTVAGNLVDATQGLTQPQESFIIPPVPSLSNDVPYAIVRTGPNDTPDDPSLQFLYTLQTSPLAWLKPADSTHPPEILVSSTDVDGNQNQWTYVRWLLDAQPLATVFTIDAALYSLMAGNLGSPPQYDYDGDTGDTLRFGDGTFGALPVAGTIFNVTYRTSAGADGNVPADTINGLPPDALGIVTATNPLAASGGADPEALEHIQQTAPVAFRAVQYRAVRPADYQTAAESLSWILRAGTAFRWTGSWLTVFTTPDPINTTQISVSNRIKLIELLNRYRMTGYESYVSDPVYLSIDLIVDVCALPVAFQSDVEEGLLTALGTSPGGFFNHNNFTFGQSLELSALEAAIQNVNGVAGVVSICYRIFGRTLGYIPMPDAVIVGAYEIIRCNNDPSLPGNGTLKLIVQGGR